MVCSTKSKLALKWLTPGCLGLAVSWLGWGTATATAQGDAKGDNGEAKMVLSDKQLPLVGSWRVTRLGEQELAEASQPTLVVTRLGSFSGYSGVNHYGGGLVEPEAAGLFGPARSTLRAAEPEAMRIEHQWFQTLHQADRAKLDDQTLQLLAGDQLLATLARVPLVGQWKVSHLMDEPLGDDAELSLEIDAEGQVGGYAGVNRFMGRLASQTDAIFGPLATTRRAGPPEAMELEQRYLRALSACDSYAIDGQSLTLMKADQPVIRLRWTKPPVDDQSAGN
jgi:heat shock protein HslJ